MSGRESWNMARIAAHRPLPKERKLCTTVIGKKLCDGSDHACKHCGHIVCSCTPADGYARAGERQGAVNRLRDDFPVLPGIEHGQTTLQSTAKRLRDDAVSAINKANEAPPDPVSSGKRGGKSHTASKGIGLDYFVHGAGGASPNNPKPSLEYRIAMSRVKFKQRFGYDATDELIAKYGPHVHDMLVHDVREYFNKQKPA